MHSTLLLPADSGVPHAHAWDGRFAQALLADERPRTAAREKHSNLFGSEGRKLETKKKYMYGSDPTKIRYIFQSLAISSREII